MSEKSSSISLKLQAWLLLIFLSIVWGTSFIFVKKIVTGNAFTAIELGAGRIFIASLALLPWAILKRKEMPSNKIGYVLLSGLLGYLWPAFIFGYTGDKLNSSLIGALNATTPLFVLVCGALFFAKTIQQKQVIGLIVALVGSLILILSGSAEKLSFDNPVALLILLATFFYGYNANILGSRLNTLSPLVISSFSLLFVGIIAFIILLPTDFFAKIFLPENRTLLFYFVLLGAINSGLAAFLYNYTLQISSPIFASSVTYLIPIVATVIGLFDGENIGIYHFVGMAVTLIGVYILNKK